MAAPTDPAERMESDLDPHPNPGRGGQVRLADTGQGAAQARHRITMPTLLLWGDSDGIVPPAYGPAFQQLLPNATLQIIERCGHIPQVERPDAFFDAIVGFLRD